MSTKVKDPAQYTQHSALSDIVSWSENRPAWQRDALRQLVNGYGCEEIDLQRLEAICLDELDDFAPIAEKDIAIQKINGEPVNLTQLKSVVGVNALAAQQELNIAENGITIIYGDNGSGKSGYCRVLKHACRTRDNKFAILPNIDETTDVAQSAEIRFKVGDQEQVSNWVANAEPTASLSNISIFDSRSANTHVQAENNVAYTPFPMRVLESLGSLCDELKKRLEEKIRRIESQTPLVISNHKLNNETPSGQYLNSLSNKSNLRVLELLCELTIGEQRRLEILQSDLSQDPQKVVRTLSAQRKRIENALSSILLVNSSLSHESMAELSELKKEYDEARKASQLASTELFNASPLPDVGSDTWRVLWEAARKFSDNVVYPDNQFPYAKSGHDRCVLCQQILDEGAIKRQNKFEEFIKSKTKANEQNCLNVLKEKKQKIESTLIPDFVRADTHIFSRMSCLLLK